MRTKGITETNPNSGAAVTISSIDPNTVQQTL